MKALELSGKKFGRLTAIQCTGSGSQGKIWECLCECGETIYTVGKYLISGNTKSCGCLQKEKAIVQAKHLGSMQAGASNPNWKGGVCGEGALVRASKVYKLWRLSVFTRDNFTCQKCGDSVSGELNAHHIKSFTRYPEDRLIEENGITLCVDCHAEFHNTYGYKAFVSYDTIEYLKGGM